MKPIKFIRRTCVLYYTFSRELPLIKNSSYVGSLKGKRRRPGLKPMRCIIFKVSENETHK